MVFISTSVEEALAKGASSVLLHLRHITPQQTFTPLPIPPLAQLDIYSNKVHKDCQRGTKC